MQSNYAIFQKQPNTVGSFLQQGIGGLFTSTVLNLLILPTILLNYGSFKKLIQR